MSAPLVSIIVPNYNHSAYLQQRLESIFNQTFQNFEVILLDDCSTDNSLDILSQYANHPKVTHFLINTINSGSPFMQWKKGIDLAEGTYTWIAESDDWAANNFLEGLLAIYEKQEDLALVFCGSNCVNHNGQPTYSFYFDKEKYNTSYVRDGNEEILEELRFGNSIINASAILFKTNILKSVKIPNYRFSGDWQVVVDVIYNKRFVFEASRLNYFRVNQEGVTYKKGNFDKELARVLEWIKIMQYISRKMGINQLTDKRYNWVNYAWLSNFPLFYRHWRFYFPPFPLVILIKLYPSIIIYGLQKILPKSVKQILKKYLRT